jgi:3-phosphoshikimate 1-carboxyvinyltransferase
MQLGVPIQKSGQQVIVKGVGRTGFTDPKTSLDCGNSGTTMRLLSGIVAGAGVSCSLTGDESLSSRTMKRIIDPLRKMGCNIKGREDNYAPLVISPHNGVRGMRYPLPIASAQLKSAVLLTGLFGKKPTEVIESELSRDHTERLLDLPSEPYGNGKIIRSSLNHTIPAQNYSVPGDFSAAAFWLAAGAIHSDSQLLLKRVGMNPSRSAFYHLLKEMGAQITQSDNKMEGKEPVADLQVTSSELTSISVDPALIPNCIDELPILMVAMCFANGKSVISGAEELRHKETDRLAAMADVLTAAGATIELKPDGIVIEGKSDFTPKASRFQTHHDHRMAMAAAILSSKCKGPSEIVDAECTAISYPEFWAHLQEVSQ